MNQDDILQRELTFLVLKYLNQPKYKDAYNTLLACLTKQPCESLALPSSSRRPNADQTNFLRELEEEYVHITPNTLLETLQSVKSVIRAGPAPGLLSILGTGTFSLSALIEQTNLEPPPLETDITNICKVLSDQALGKSTVKRNITLTSTYNPTLITRILGHLAPIYCVIFDKTHTVAITGADDAVIKIWSLEKFCLVATLRGHKKEISDLDINVTNTMLASAGCDKEIRIWSLQTTQTLAVLAGHRGSVNKIEFSPTNDYLVSCGNDGYVCFWPILENSVSDEPITFFERLRSTVKLLCSGFSEGGTVCAAGSSSGDIFVYTIRGELGLPTKDTILEGHRAMVISISFAKHSLCFVSGSKDGTVRIWNKDQDIWDDVVCNARTPLVPDRDPTEQIDILVAQWSAEDITIIASCSDTSIRVWNRAGDLIQTLLGHDDEVYVIQVHPCLPDILVTCGTDSQIITWSLSRGTVINTFLNAIEGEGRAALYEGDITSDGMFLVTADANGHIVILGNELLCNTDVEVPKQQFFNTDYIPLIRDRYGFVLDEQSELPPYMVGPPYLVDQQGMALPAHIQADIPGRHVLSVQNVKHRMLQNQADRLKRLESLRLANSNRNRFTSGDPPEEYINPDLADFHRSFMVHTSDYENYIAPVVAPPSTYNLFEGSLSRSIALIDPNKSRELWLNRPIAPKLSELQVREYRNLHEKCRIKELHSFDLVINNRVLVPKPRDRKKSPGVRKTRQTIIDYESIPSSSSSDQEEGLNSSDDEWKLNSPNQPQRSKKRKVVIEEENSDEYESRSNVNNDSLITITSSSDDAKSEETCSETEERLPKRKSKRKKKKMSSSVQKIIKMFGVTSETVESLEPPEWLTIVTPVRTPYLPQISDKIYYFVQGHKDYYNSEHAPPKSKKSSPWDDHEFKDVELCKVLSVSFITGPPTLCQVALGILNEKDEVTDTFQFRYHDAPNIPDFMVLKQHYEDSMSCRWIKGDKFRSLIDGKWWEGVLVGRNAVNEKQYPKSPWRRIVVKWDADPEMERLSVWDIEPLPKDTRSSKRRSPSKKHNTDGSGSSTQQFTFNSSNPVTGPLDPYILNYYHSNGTWGSETREDFKERLCVGLTDVMQRFEAREFLYSVNINDHPDYYHIIGYPIDLTTIHNRLLHDHYRSIDSVMWEVRQLEINARVYNEDSSDIVKDVTYLVCRILIFIEDSALKRINVDVTPEMINAKLECRSNRSQRKRRQVKQPVKNPEWFPRAVNILESIVAHNDSLPFRTPIDLTMYTDYLEYCEEPMDFDTVFDKLHSCSYEYESQFYKDIELVISNSFAYNTRPSSQIYKITTRLKEYYHSLIDHLGDDISDEKQTVPVPVQLIVPRVKKPIFSGKEKARKPIYSSCDEEEHFLEEKENVIRTTKPIYSSSEESEQSVEKTDKGEDSIQTDNESDYSEPCKSGQSSCRNSKASTIKSKKLSSGSSKHSDMSDESDVKSNRPRRQKTIVYEELSDEPSEKGSDENNHSSSEPSPENSDSDYSAEERHRKKKHSAVKNKKQKARTSVSRKNKQNGHYHTDLSSGEEKESSSEEDSVSEYEENARITRGKKRRRDAPKNPIVTTKRGRSVKKNMKYHDFF